MILILAGTSEGRELASVLEGAGFSLMVTAVTDYGAFLAAEVHGVSQASAEGLREVLKGALTGEDLRNLISNKGIKALVDATHPYARAISTEAVRVCKELNIPYLRFERESAQLPEITDLHRVGSYPEAAVKAAALGDTIFLTTGTRGLEEFLSNTAIQEKRIIARVLPEPDGIQKCRDLGLLPRDIVAMQGPFTEELNLAMFTNCGADVIVTKESGIRGGTDTKLSAARSLRIPIVVIERPEVEYPNVTGDSNEVIDFLKGVVR